VTESPKFSRLIGNRVEEHDGNVGFKSGSGNMAVSCIRNASGHYRTNPFTVDLAMGRYHVPRNVFLVNINIIIAIIIIIHVRQLR